MKLTEHDREKVIEKRACDWAEADGWYVRKFSAPGRRGVPDRIFIKNGRVVFIEFKTEKGKPTQLQKHELLELQNAGVEAYIARTAEEVKLILLNKHLDAPQRKKGPEWLD